MLTATGKRHVVTSPVEHSSVLNYHRALKHGGIVGQPAWLPPSSVQRQAGSSPYNDDYWKALLKAKYSQIAAFHKLATQRGTCLRAGIIRYFEKQQAKHRKSLGLRIVEWLFVSRTKPIVTKHCCDKCTGVSKDNFAERVRSVFQLQRQSGL